MLEVIGAGVGRTGTHSLKIALEQLIDGSCHHMIEVIPNPEQQRVWTDAIDDRPVDWAALMAGYVSQVDWPGASFWPELTGTNPDALVILSLRDPDQWYTSCSNTIFGMKMLADMGDEWMQALVRMMNQRFDDRFEDRDAMIAAFERHNDAVRAGVPAERLLEWTVTDGWAPICARLDVAVPDGPFPRTNSTEEWRALVGMPPLAPV
jgi:Sulfotransferase domain